MLPADTPGRFRRLLRRCLEKDRKRRLADIADARLEIDDVLSAPHADAAAPVSISRTRERLMWASALMLVGLIGVAALTWSTRIQRRTLPKATRTLLSMAPTDQSSGANPLEQRPGGARPTRTAIALSPDGKTLVFAAIWGGEQQLYARRMDRLDVTPIPGTSGGSNPFFSPDGGWVGFAAAGELRKVPLAGGPAVMVCKAAALFGASWGTNGTIVFATARNGGLWRVSAEGGTPEVLTTPRPGEVQSPVTPYLARRPRRHLHDLKGGESLGQHADRRAISFNERPDRTHRRRSRWALRAYGAHRLRTSGYTHGRSLRPCPARAHRWGDRPHRRRHAGRRLQLERYGEYAGGPVHGLGTGTLVYVTGGVLPAIQRSLAWVDRKGTSQPLSAPPRTYRTPRLSPEGGHVSAYIGESIRQVWSYDIARGALSAITVDGRSSYGIFAPDQKRIVFRSGAAGGEDNLTGRQPTAAVRRNA